MSGSKERFTAWWLFEFFNVINQEQKTKDKWFKYFQTYAWIDEESYKNAKYLDDLVIIMRIFPREHKELVEIEKTIPTNVELKDEVFSYVMFEIIEPLIKKAEEKFKIKKDLLFKIEESEENEDDK